MSIAAEKVAEALALPERDRAYLAHQLIASLDNTADADAEAQWQEVIDRRSREMEEGKVSSRPMEQVLQDIRLKAVMHLHRRPFYWRGAFSGCRYGKGVMCRRETGRLRDRFGRRASWAWESGSAEAHYL